MMFKRFSFCPSHAAGVELQCGVSEVELPIELVDPHGLFWDSKSERSVWFRGSEEEFHVRSTLLCHGAPMHSVPVRTRLPSTYDERRCSVVWGELMRFPVKVRELTLDATLAFSVVGEDGRAIASASLALFDDKGVLKQGLVKLALRDERLGDDTLTRKANSAASRAAALGGGRGTFIDGLRGDDEYERQFERTDYLFRADKLRQGLAAARRRLVADSMQRQRAAEQPLAASATTERVTRQRATAAHQLRKDAAVAAWLDELALARVNEVRAHLSDREAWFRAPHTTRAERAMLTRAFLIVDLPTFEHPVLWEEKPYTGAPQVAANSSREPLILSTVPVTARTRQYQHSFSDHRQPLATARSMTLHASSKRGASAPHVLASEGPLTLKDGQSGQVDVEATRRVAASRPRSASSLPGEEGPIVYDYEDGVVKNPIEDKYRALARDATRALVDRELKPNVDEAKWLARIITSPSDELTPADRELVWKFRYTLKGNAKALPKFLLSVDWRVEAEVAQVRELLDDWRDRTPIDIADALKLLGPEKAFQHDVVRSFAVDALRSATDLELIAYLLQLVQALRYSESRRKAHLASAGADGATSATTQAAASHVHELVVDTEDAARTVVDSRLRDSKEDIISRDTVSVLDDGFDDDDDDDSPLAAFLSDRACASLAVANFVWWYLKVGADDMSDEAACCAYRVFRNRFREELAERAPETYETLRAQEQLMASVLAAHARARQEKGRKDHKQERLRALLSELRFPKLVLECGVPMPLDPSVRIRGLHEPKTTTKMYRSAMYPAVVAFERQPEQRLQPQPGRAQDAVEARGGNTEVLTTSGHGRPEYYRSRLFSQRRRKRPATDDMQPAVPPEQTAALSTTAKSIFDTVGSLASAAFGSSSDAQTSGDKPFLRETHESENFEGAGGHVIMEPNMRLQPLSPYRVLVKNGDDLRQDQLVLQFVLLMDLLLKRVNLDLKLTCFRALATGANSGLIELVEDSQAISAILAKHHNSIIEFLRIHNPDPTTPDGISAESRDNFTKSTAGYCVITYLLGIGDRHLDNIMVRNNGCLFHIDFGFILGKDPKPYPPPFRLTKEMAEAMGYPDDPNYTQKFKTKCCQAFNCLRKHAPLLLNLMSLMKDAGIEHLEEETAISKFQDRFRLDLGDEDAERFFLSLINESLNALVPVVLERFHKIAVWMK